MSVSYSFSEVDVFLIVDAISDFVTLPFGLSIGVPIQLSKRDFFGNDGVITITPNQNAISSEENSIEGDALWDISNDMSGTATIHVGDFSPAHILLSSIYTFHQSGFLVGNISLNVNQRPFGQTTGIASLASLLYTCRKGAIKAVPEKGWSGKQNENAFTMQFNYVSGGLSLTGGVSKYLSF